MLNHNQYGFSSKNLCVRPRTGPCTRGGTPLDGLRGQQPDDGRPSAEKQAMMDNMKATDKVEQQVRDALFARSTAHKGEERILRAAFSKFDKDRSATVDFDEFSKALEHLGLHTEGKGLEGHGGLKAEAVRSLFARYDTDGSGSIEYEEFCAAITKEGRTTKML